MENDGRFGSEVHRLRKERGLSQVDLSRLAGLDQSYLSRIERGDDPPPSSLRILALADVLGANREALLTLAGRTLERRSDNGIDRNIQVAAAARSLLPIGVDSLGIIVALVELMQVVNRMASGSHEIKADRTALTAAYHRFVKESEWVDSKTRKELLDMVMSMVVKSTGKSL